MNFGAIVILCVGVSLSGCASTVTAIKGRSFGDHPLKPGYTYVATGDRRFAFVFPADRFPPFEPYGVPRERVCVEPQPDLSVTIGAKSNPTVNLKVTGADGDASTDKSFGFDDQINPIGQVTTNRGEKSDTLQHQIFAICMARANGDMDFASAQAAILRLAEATAKNIEAPGKSAETVKPEAVAAPKGEAEKLGELNASRAKAGLPSLSKLPSADEAAKLKAMNEERSKLGLEPLSKLPG